MRYLYALNFRLLIMGAVLGWYLPMAKAQTTYAISGTTFIDYNDNKQLDAKDLRHPVLAINVYASADTIIDVGVDNLLGSTVSGVNGEYTLDVVSNANFNYLLLEISESDIFADITNTVRNTLVIAQPDNGTTTIDNANVSYLGQPVICYASADDKLDKLMFVNRKSGNFISAALDFSGAAPDGLIDEFIEIETVAFDPNGRELWTVNKGTLGTINLSTGVFEGNATPLGTINGTEGAITVNDVDGLSFDPFSNILYALGRQKDDVDFLFQIDINTGMPVAGAFVNDAVTSDYVIIDVQGADNMQQDIDDIAINPADGKLYGVNSDDADDTMEYLIEINKQTGVSSRITVLKDELGNDVTDVEGFGYTNFGLLIATTGGDSKNSSHRNRMFDVTLDLANNNATLSLIVNNFGKKIINGQEVTDDALIGKDIEGCDCLIAPTNIISGKVYWDENANMVNDNELGLGGNIKILIYIDADGNNEVSEGDILVDSVRTQPDGTYSWATAANTDLVMEVDQETIRDLYAPNDDEKEEADLTCCFGGQEDSNNDFGYTGPEPFPVEWLGFEAVYEKQNAHLDWATASEINSHYFEVQRSFDAIDFESIGKVDAKGNANTVTNYQYLDKGVNLLSRAKLYYRLRQVDFDGQWEYSNIVELNISDRAFGLKVYPNPASSTLTVHNTHPNGKSMEILLIDVRGKFIRNGVIEPSQKLEWSVNDLARGVYYLRATQDDHTFHQKVIVE